MSTLRNNLLCLTGIYNHLNFSPHCANLEGGRTELGKVWLNGASVVRRERSLGLVSFIISFSSHSLGCLELTTFTLSSNLTIKPVAAIQLMLHLEKLHMWESEAPLVFFITSHPPTAHLFYSLPSQRMSPELFLSLDHLVKFKSSFTNEAIQIEMLILQQFADSRNTIF